MDGTIINITRFCTDDGPGIRTTVFLKGCPLKCAWCHNPESQSPAIEFYRDGEKIGERLSAEEVVEKLSRDRVFYDASGGGITVSGGEPLFQPDFTADILARCQKAGLHTAIETSGYASPAVFQRVIRHCDLILLDLKETDAERHRRYTGVPLQPILDNLRLLDTWKKPYILRLPVIPGWNDRESHLRRARALVEHSPGCQRLQIMPYHRLGAYKYDRLERPYACAAVAEPTGEQRAAWEAYLTEQA